MSDKKISQLSTATMPLAGTEVVPVVQGGVTKKVPVSDLTAGRDVSIKMLTVTDNVVIGTSGKGIDFSATAGTGTSELLADYEEGTWTPLLSKNGAGVDNFTSSTAVGRYTKIGRLVTIECTYTYTAKQSDGDAYTFMTGLPFASVNNGGFFYVGMNGSGGADTATYSGVITSSNYIAFLKDNYTTGIVYFDGNGFPAATRTVTFQASYAI